MRGRDRIALASCAVTIGFCALAFGGAVRWAAIGASLGAIGMAAAYVGSRRYATERSPLTVLIALAIGLTAIQLVPIPSAIASELLGAKLDLVTANQQAWGAPAPSSVMASYDPPATLVELAKLCGYAALAFAACRLATQRRGKRALAIVAVGGATAVAVVALLHGALGAHEIYGAFSSPALPRMLSPIVNDNHLASLMAMAVPLAIGLAVTSAGIQRLGWSAAGFACASVALIISSRSGAIGLVAGLTVVAGILVAQHRRDADRSRGFGRQTIARITIVGCLVVLVGLLTANQVFEELVSTRTNELSEPHSKFQVWVHSVDLIEENHWLGVGRGAFEPAYTRWSVVGDTTYSHAENSYLEAAIDWGLPGAMLLAIAAGLVVLAVVRRWQRTPLEAGALGALASLAIHDLADFSLELPIVAMMAVLALAILLPARVSSDSSAGHPTPTRTSTRWIRIGLLAAAGGVCLLAASPLGRLAHADAADSDLESLSRASERHPADFLLLGRAAQVMMERGDPRAAALAMRALAINPTHTGLHRLAATLLVRSNHLEQAKVELALGLRYATPNTMYQTLDEVAATFPTPEDAAGALPMDVALAPQLDKALRVRHFDALELAYAKRLAIMNPDAPIAQSLLADVALRSSRGDLALPAARLAYRAAPDVAAVIAVARASALSGDAAGALATLDQALAEGRTLTQAQRAEILEAKADLEITTERLEALTRTLAELDTVVSDEAGRIEIHKRRLRLHELRGELNQATWERDQIRAIEKGVNRD